MHRSVRVAMVAPFGLRPKGTTIARVLPIGRELVRQGATVRLIIPPWDDRRRAEQTWWEDGVEIVHTGLGGGPLEPIFIMRDILRLVREHNPAVVHIFKPIGYSGLAAILLRKVQASGQPVRIVVDADDLEGPAGWGGRHGHWLSSQVRGLQERYVLRHAPALTVASHWLCEYAVSLGVPRDRIRYLPNGHDEPDWTVHGEEPGEPIDTPTLLWYTRFTEAAPERATALLAPLLKADPRRRLAIVGEEIAEGARAKLARCLSEAGVDLQVDWLGYDPEGIGRYVARRRGHLVAVYPMDDDPVNRARCPSKIPQLMALGVPVVAEAVGEIPRYLDGIEFDILVPPGDAVRFQELAKVLLTEPTLRDTVEKCLLNVGGRWQWGRIAAGLLNWQICT